MISAEIAPKTRLWCHWARRWETAAAAGGCVQESVTAHTAEACNFQWGVCEVRTRFFI